MKGLWKPEDVTLVRVSAEEVFWQLRQKRMDTFWTQKKQESPHLLTVATHCYLRYHTSLHLKHFTFVWKLLQALTV